MSEECVSQESGRLQTTYIAQADILNQGRVDLRLGQCLLQQRVDDVVQLGILETTLARLGQWCAKRQCDYNIVGVLLSTAFLC